MNELDKARKRFQDDVQEYGTEWRDAEIERLNSNQVRWSELVDRYAVREGDMKQLITELADALSHYALLNNSEKALITRAREATT